MLKYLTFNPSTVDHFFKGKSHSQLLFACIDATATFDIVIFALAIFQRTWIPTKDSCGEIIYNNWLKPHLPV